MLVDLFPIGLGGGVRFGVIMFISMCFLAGFSYVINLIFIRFSQKLGTNNYSAVSQDRWSKMPKPIVGGLSFYLIFLISSQLAGIFGFGYFSDNQFLALVLSASVGFFVGLQDDAYNTRPFIKFLGQFLCGLILIIFGNSIHLTDNIILDSLLTIFWVVGIMNSINMLDNMDGITASVSLTILAAVLLINYSSGGGFGLIEWTILATIAALAGFLMLNYSPSKLYMGDTGSQFLGALLAFAGIKYLWNQPLINCDFAAIHQLLLPVLIFLVPIMDTSFVSVARIKRGQSPFVGGRDHTTHHLHYFGITEKLIPITLSAITILSTIIVIAIQLAGSQWQISLYLFGAIFIIIVVLTMLYFYQKGLIIKQQEAESNYSNQNNSTSSLTSAVLN
ncbi:MAG: undecaprenyl/decaprenyl-phosphate alpha-N-acetylglucosaminyl 1-phosphate transferase [Bacteroidia bacterium]|nr:undecaprenyl/decaprenyl-phosphate alpha-N-acetylglucosaminyl 1-phosphate transferase [Bacteroidia bacterium]